MINYVLHNIITMVTKWKDEYNIGISEVDEQHRHLIHLINEVNISVSKNISHERIVELVNEVFNYIATHFTTEEENLDLCNYKFSNQHKNAHNKLIVDALKFKYVVETEGIKIVPDFMNFLEQSMIQHIEKHDMKFGDFLRKNNLLNKQK